jgi:hypothetical protein
MFGYQLYALDLLSVWRWSGVGAALELIPGHCVPLYFTLADGEDVYD